MEDWIDYGKTWRDFCYKDGLAKSGVQIEVEGGLTFLIGDINELAGTCDDCRAFNTEAIVVRYRRVIDEDVLT